MIWRISLLNERDATIIVETVRHIDRLQAVAKGLDLTCPVDAGYCERDVNWHRRVYSETRVKQATIGYLKKGTTIAS